MKTLKLRAWDEQNKVMHNDFQFIKSGEENNDWIVFTSDRQKLTDEPHPLSNPYFQQQLKITEGIGLKDCNEKEYFVNDIVQTDTIIQFIDYNNELCCYGVRQFGGGATMSIDKSWKIIGNIYENPEFLQGAV
jgi:hypothetical protein